MAAELSAGVRVDAEGREHLVAPADYADQQPVRPPAAGFLARHVFSRDHKVVGKQFLWFGLFFLFWGGAMAMLMRWQLGFPGTSVPAVGKLLFPWSGGVIPPQAYTALFTMHGTIMIFFALTPLLIGAFGHYLIPLMCGARGMAFPTLSLLSFWTNVAAGIVLLAGFFLPLGPASGGWQAYPTLSTKIGQPGLGQTLWVLAIVLTGVATVMAAVNYLTTIARLRAPGMTWTRLPLTVWGLFYTSLLNALFVPVVAAGMLLLFFDRVLGTHFFVAGTAAGGAAGDPILYQHLFWIFGHPEVYIVILPAWGVVADLLAFHARKPAYGYRATVLSLGAITLLSSLVYGHHMFVVGMSPLLSEAFMLLTMLVSVPSAVLFLNWLGTMWRGALRFPPAMLFAVGVVVVFALGGLTGLHLGAIGTDVYLHDSYFVVGHFHLTMAASVLFGVFAAIYFWFPKMFGRTMNETLGRWHFWLSLVPLVVVFGGMLVLGYGGMQRRLYNPFDFDFLRPLQPLNVWISVAAFVLGAAQILFLGNFLQSLVSGRRAHANPWNVGTLEWTLSSPPPPHGFDEIPVVVRGPHELSNPEVRGRDWIAQDEPLPPRETHASRTRVA